MPNVIRKQAKKKKEHGLKHPCTDKKCQNNSEISEEQGL